MTRETRFARVLLVLVLAPSGGLFGKAVAEAAQARPWWPWLVAALVWLLVLSIGLLGVREFPAETYRSANSYR